jgi:hypothetical protein
LSASGKPLQSRLPVLLALAGSKTIGAADAFLLDYIPRFNAAFAVKPAGQFSAYVPLPPHYDLDRLLCAEITRSLSSGSTVSISKALFRIEQDELPPKSKGSVLFSEKRGIRVWANGKYFPVTPLSDIPLSDGVVRTGDFPKVVQLLLHKFLFADAKAVCLALSRPVRDYSLALAGRNFAQGSPTAVGEIFTG